MTRLVAAAAAALVVAVATGPAHAVSAEVLLDVAFLPGGDCHVGTGTGTVSRQPGAAPPDDSFACRLPSLPEKTPIRLTVTLPEGARPGGANFPRLAWQLRAGVWRGTATLPSAPTLVRIPVDGGAADRAGRLLDAATLAGAALAVAWTLARGRRS